MRRRIAIITLAVTALTVVPASVAQADVKVPASTAPSFCFDLFGIGICVPAVL